MYKPGDIITYRDTPYEYQEWTTYNGKQATGFRPAISPIPTNNWITYGWIVMVIHVAGWNLAIYHEENDGQNRTMERGGGSDGGHPDGRDSIRHHDGTERRLA